MSQIDFSKAPEGATHFEAKASGLIEWFMLGDKCYRWSLRLSAWEEMDIAYSSAALMHSEAIPVTCRSMPDWRVAPERATHYVYSERTTVAPGWYVADGVKMRLCGVDDEYTFRLDDVHPTCGLTLVERPPVAPDWGTAPKYATHYAPRVTLDAFHYLPLWLKAEDGSYLKAVWENDWFWRPYGALEKGRAETLIARPVAEPAPFSPDWANAPEDATHHARDKCEAPWRKVVGGDVFMWHRGAWELIGMPAGLGEYVPRPAVEFVPRDFSGEVRDFGPAAKLAEMGWAKAPEWATLFLVNVQHPAMYAWASALEKGAKFERLDGTDCTGHLLPEFWQVVGERPSADWSGCNLSGDGAAWNGEGLPPVGIECERSFSHNTWKVTTICGHSTNGAYAAFYDGDGLMGWSDDCKFRPIRTPEQIASDKRLHAVRNACTDIAEALKALHESQEHTAVAVVEAMIDAGYSKAVEVSQ